MICLLTVDLPPSVLGLQVEPRLPPLFWAIPFSSKLYNLLVPAEDENQVRQHLFVLRERERERQCVRDV